MDETREELERRYGELLREKQGWCDAMSGLESLLRDEKILNVRWQVRAETLSNQLQGERSYLTQQIEMLRAERRASDDLIRRLRSERESLAAALRAVTLMLGVIGEDNIPERFHGAARKVSREAQEALLILENHPPV